MNGTDSGVVYTWRVPHLIRSFSFLYASVEIPGSFHFPTIHKGAVNYLREGSTAFIPSDFSPQSHESFLCAHTHGPDSLSGEM